MPITLDQSIQASKHMMPEMDHAQMQRFSSPFDFEATLAQLRIDPDAIAQHVVVDGDQHLNPKQNALLAPVMLQTSDLAVFKSLVGRPDHNPAKTHWDLPSRVWSGRKVASAAELSEIERQDIELAYHNYIYGDAGVVASYKSIIEQLHGQFEIAVYAAKRVTLGPGSVLEVSGAPALLLVDELIINGGRLQFLTACNVRVNKLTKTHQQEEKHV